MGDSVHTAQALRTSYEHVRALSESLCAPLEIEDYQVQPIPEVSPPKWHLAHVTWFFESMIVARFKPEARPFHTDYHYLFNSYYEGMGARWPRPERGLASRPTVKQVYDYRRAIDDQMLGLIDLYADDPEFAKLVEIGLHHEQQHQELLVTDIKYIFFNNAIRPIYSPRETSASAFMQPRRFLGVEGGIHRVGHDEEAFAYDNESPAHRVYVDDFEIANRPVTNGEYLEFINDGGYSDFRHWLSDGWSRAKSEEWQAPLYWFKKDESWFLFTMSAERPVEADEPVCHLSYYEAAAFASWAGMRLPTELEWEIAAQTLPTQRKTNDLQTESFHPQSPLEGSPGELLQLYGDVWEWTGSAYLPYPGYRPLEGPLFEYNGKFMSDQMVLRGGSCATPAGHIRRTYRNFFQPYQRWQFSGLRVARSG